MDETSVGYQFLFPAQDASGSMKEHIITDTHDAVLSWEHFLPMFRDHLEELPVLLRTLSLPTLVVGCLGMYGGALR